MRRLTTALCVAAAGAVAVVPGTATADHCNGDIHEAGGFYVDIRQLDTEGWSVWVYEESNSVAGLQSGGNSVLGADVSTENVQGGCDHPNPDTLIF